MKNSIWWCFMSVVLIALFLRGYLLTKVEIEKSSRCQDYSVGDISESCWSRPRYKKVVIVLIDALRHDFTLYNSSISLEDVKPWQNKMPIFSEILAKHPKKSRHYEFIADPPTATFLRLKGLTTGGLPTFVDLGSNFGASEISEDNWVKQLSDNNRSLVFMGDDTWEGLYKEYFYRSFPYPSFDVWDLHTVDNGVWDHLVPEIKRSDWDVIVAHFLGVDHAGHRYHVNHPELSLKLKQMNERVKETIKAIAEDTLLLIFGDHGMTTSGDHGGDTHDEVSASLFVYSGSDLGEIEEKEKEILSPSKVYQTDLVPTLTMLLGVPTPFSSLGNLIPSLFISKEDDRQQLAHAMFVTTNQVFRYIRSYAEVTTEFTASDITKLETELTNLNSEYTTTKSFRLSLFAKQQKYIRTIRDLCLSRWAQFNLPLMALSILLIFLLAVLMIVSIHSKIEIKIYAMVTFVVAVVTAADSLSLWRGLTHPITVILALVTTIMSSYTLCQTSILQFVSLVKSLTVKNLGNLRPSELVAILMLVLMSVGFTTNSYILVEDMVMIFFFSSLLLILFVEELADGFYVLTKQTLVLAGLVSGCLVASRSSTMFYGCREEQFWCTKSTWFDVKEDNINSRYAVSVLSLILAHFMLYYYQKINGNLVGNSVMKYIITIVTPTECVIVSVYWALSASPTSHLTQEQLCWLPRTCYITSLISIIALVYKPLSLFIHPSNREIPLVYGISTAYSSPFLVLQTILLTPAALLLGERLSPTLLVLILELNLASYITRHCRATLLTKLVLLHIISVQYFYATKHQAAVQSIDWNAGFVGFTTHIHNIVPATMITIRTLIGVILCSLSSPLFIFSVEPSESKIVSVDLDNTEPDAQEMVYYTKPTMFDKFSRIASMAPLSLMLFKCVLACLACYIHRRHLMVWNIFTPRAILEMGLCVCVGVCSLFVLFLLNRIDRALKDSLGKLKHST